MQVIKLHLRIRNLRIIDLHIRFAYSKSRWLENFSFQVTWIRRKDRQLLTLGTDTHVIDTRFMVISNSPDWTLLIKNVQREDAGLYECQVII